MSARVQPARAARMRLERQRWDAQHAGHDITYNAAGQTRCRTCYAERRRAAMPDDGIVDEIAIERAIAGSRTVRLTPRERDVAAHRLARLGLEPHQISNRLGANAATIRAALKRPEPREVEMVESAA